MAAQAVPEKSINTPSERGAEFLNLIIESFELLQSLSIQQLGLHTTRTHYLKKAKATGDAQLIQHAEQEEVRLAGCWGLKSDASATI